MSEEATPAKVRPNDGLGVCIPERDRACEQGCNGCDDCTDYEDDDPWNEPAATCKHCRGTGGDPWNDGITPCEHCDGEGYEWWK